MKKAEQQFPCPEGVNVKEKKSDTFKAWDRQKQQWWTPQYKEWLRTEFKEKQSQLCPFNLQLTSEGRNREQTLYNFRLHDDTILTHHPEYCAHVIHKPRLSQILDHEVYKNHAGTGKRQYKVLLDKLAEAGVDASMQQLKRARTHSRAGARARMAQVQEQQGSPATSISAESMKKRCENAERQLLGEIHSGSIKQRIEGLEKEFFGNVQHGGLKERLEMIEREL
jgi:hypothetical protein